MFNYARGGAYHERISHYIDVFGRERVFVILFEDLFGDSTEKRAALETFLNASQPPRPLPYLNVGGQISSPLLRKILNHPAFKAGLPRLLPVQVRNGVRPYVYKHVKVSRPSLRPEVQSELRKRFAPATGCLEDLIGRSTGWPRS